MRSVSSFRDNNVRSRFDFNERVIDDFETEFSQLHWLRSFVPVLAETRAHTNPFVSNLHAQVAYCARVRKRTSHDARRTRCFGASCIFHTVPDIRMLLFIQLVPELCFPDARVRLSHSRDKSGSMVENGVISKYSIVSLSIVVIFHATRRHFSILLCKECTCSKFPCNTVLRKL